MLSEGLIPIKHVLEGSNENNLEVNVDQPPVANSDLESLDQLLAEYVRKARHNPGKVNHFSAYVKIICVQLMFLHISLRNVYFDHCRD